MQNHSLWERSIFQFLKGKFIANEISDLESSVNVTYRTPQYDLAACKYETKPARVSTPSFS
jgi:hypothetical protein